jgi:hypothetical protein
MTQHFGYAVDRRYLPLLLPFRFKRDRDGVTLSDDTFEATFGHPGPRRRPGRSCLTRRTAGRSPPS